MSRAKQVTIEPSMDNALQCNFFSPSGIHSVYSSDNLKGYIPNE